MADTSVLSRTHVSIFERQGTEARGACGPACGRAQSNLRTNAGQLKRYVKLEDVRQYVAPEWACCERPSGSGLAPQRSNGGCGLLAAPVFVDVLVLQPKNVAAARVTRRRSHDVNVLLAYSRNHSARSRDQREHVRRALPRLSTITTRNAGQKRRL